MKLLVTGGAGYIGSVVTRHLLAAGHEVIVLDDLRRGSLSRLPPEAKIVRASVDDVTVLEHILPGVSAILHFAASIEVDQSMSNPAAYFENNTAGTIKLLSAALRAGVNQIVFSSTAAVYGHPVETPITESHPLAPTNPYGESKLMVEKVLNWLHDQVGLRYAILRYFNAAGGVSRNRGVNLIPIVLEVAQGCRPHLEVFGTDYQTPDGTAIRDYVHVEDLASAHLLALHALKDKSRMTYNLGSDVGFSVYQVVEVARAITAHPIPLVLCGRRPGDPATVVASSAAIREELAWRPRHSTLERIIGSAWTQAEPDVSQPE